MVQQISPVRGQKVERGLAITRLIDADVNALMTQPHVLDRILADIAAAPAVVKDEPTDDGDRWDGLS